MDTLNFNVDARIMARENKDASILDGYRNRLTVNASYVASKTTQIQFSSIVSTEETKTNIQNNRDYSLNISINKTFNAPFNLLKDPLSAGLSFGGSFREYAGPNPTIDPDTTRNDYTFRFSPSLTITAGETMAILLSGGLTRVDSNIPNSEYDNISVTVGISKQF